MVDNFKMLQEKERIRQRKTETERQRERECVFMCVMVKTIRSTIV